MKPPRPGVYARIDGNHDPAWCGVEHDTGYEVLLLDTGGRWWYLDASRRAWVPAHEKFDPMRNPDAPLLFHVGDNPGFVLGVVGDRSTTTLGGMVDNTTGSTASP